ncbi:hypothetical protein C798_12975 [Herbaspirillum rubrisubalbicans Os34]|uniref:ATPase involved in DNA repair n=1 Tax=Herbaspirillum rubrisubalbicans Os34 TaxID=1235827 RepID=A0A6M3ZS71_9BURK|nr:hypothetical protein [Herbaspirillum rubrisubalbicans]QJQ01113.1 hypothetical protein C798_12975 [Herbaspirillum rubrisubalbicans Os34]
MDEKNFRASASVDAADPARRYANMAARELSISRQREDLDKREAEYSQRIKDVEDSFSKRIHTIERRENEVKRQQDRFDKLLDEFHKERITFHAAVKEREEALTLGMAELESEKKRYLEEAAKKIQQKSEKYVAQALVFLGTKEKRFHTYSAIWSCVGAGAIFLAVGIAAWATVLFVPDHEAKISWQFLLFISLKGLILVGLSLALARYAFLFSSRYMKEALKNAERRHAIQFGAFYLDSYGGAADWTQVKEAFKDWNISLVSDGKNVLEEGNLDPTIGSSSSEIIAQFKNFSEEFGKISTTLINALKKE